jgi:dienelactone hydrolase
MRIVFVLACLAACGGGKKPAPTVPADASAADASPAADASSDAPPSEDITFAGNEVEIAATYYGPADRLRDQGCAIFVHQLSSTRAEYQPVIDRLRGRGHLLAIDMRGHGRSTKGAGGTTLDWQQFETADWEKVASDIAAATEEMVKRGADHHCVLIGSSIGSSAVLLHAARSPDSTRALVLLSPGLAYRGVKTPDAARAVNVPVLIVHSQEGGAADAAGALAGIWRDATPPVPVEVIEDPGDKHGMKIVAGDPKILERVVAFIGAELAK